MQHILCRAKLSRATITAQNPNYEGSIAIDGVSLTVNAVADEYFEVALIPHTLQVTAFAETALGAPVNLEIDLLARYLDRLQTGPR